MTYLSVCKRIDMCFVFIMKKDLLFSVEHVKTSNGKE